MTRICNCAEEHCDHTPLACERQAAFILMRKVEADGVDGHGSGEQVAMCGHCTLAALRSGKWE